MPAIVPSQMTIAVPASTTFAAPERAPTDAGAVRSISALVTALSPTRASTDARRAVHELLSTGKLGREVPLPGAEVGINGRRHAFQVGVLNGVPVSGVSKAYNEQAPQELLAEAVASTLGIGHLLPVVGARRDGGIVMQTVPGAPANQAGVHSAAALEQTLSAWYAKSSGMSHAHAASRARHDHQMISVFDYITANSDRRSANLMIDPQTSTAQLIDHGNIGLGEQLAGGQFKVPVMQHPFIGGELQPDGSYRLQLDHAVVETLRQIDPARLRASHAVLDEIVGSQPMKTGSPRLWNQVRSAGFTDNMVARFEQLRDTGLLTYRKLEPPPLLPQLTGGYERPHNPGARGFSGGAQRF